MKIILAFLLAIIYGIVTLLSLIVIIFIFSPLWLPINALTKETNLIRRSIKFIMNIYYKNIMIILNGINKYIKTLNK